MNDYMRSELQSTIQQNNQDLLSNLGQLIDSKLGEMKRVADEAASQQLREIKRMKFNDVPEFKRKANKDQFHHNSKVLQCLDEAKENLTENKPVEVMKSLEEGTKLIQDRQKLVLIADKSPFGWLTVENYKSNALASDEDDEKRLFRAENKAASEVKRRQSLRKPKSGTPNQSHRNPAPPQPTQASPSQAPSFRKGSCYACGKFGHWRSECHSLNSQAGSSQNKA